MTRTPIRAADHIVEMGPGAGVHGGNMVAQGRSKTSHQCKASPTGLFFSGKRWIALPATPQSQAANLWSCAGRAKTISRASMSTFPSDAGCHNRSVGFRQKHADQRDPLQGVSGNGWSTLERFPGDTTALTARSTFTKSSTSTNRRLGATAVRTLQPTSASTTPSATVRANASRVEREYKSGRFSFNVKGGRCEECQGEGVITTQLYFMPDVEVTCAVAKERASAPRPGSHFARQDHHGHTEHVHRGGRAFFARSPLSAKSRC